MRRDESALLALRRARPGGRWRDVLRGAPIAVVLTSTLVLGVPSDVPSANAQDASAPASPRSDAGTSLPTVPAQAVGIPSTLSVALVEGATGQVLVAQDATTRRPIASAIKLLTALVVVDALPTGTLVTVGEEVLGVEGASYGLRPGEVRSVEDLLAGLLLRSGNDVAVALAVSVAGSEESFVDLMAERLAMLGIEARPESASGLAAGDALSALELAVVARASLDEPRIRDLVGRTSLVLPSGSELVNRNAFLLDDPSATGLKTGFTGAAGFTLAASSERDDRALIAIVLGARDDAERRDAARRLVEHGYSATWPTPTVATLELRTSTGPVAWRADLGVVTVPVGSPMRFVWPDTLRPIAGAARAELLVGDAPAGDVALERFDTRDIAGTVGLGRALADGVYAALRPAAIAIANEPTRSTGGALR